jgi:hypothetical protein
MKEGKVVWQPHAHNNRSDFFFFVLVAC